MSFKKAIVFVKETEKAKIKTVKSNVERILATYPDSVLADVNEKQMASLKKLGVQYKLQEEGKIKLASVEFDISNVPTPPPTLKLARAQIAPETKTYWIVKFAGPISPQWRKEINTLGATVTGYVPDNAVIARMDSNVKEKVQKLPYVTWIGPYEPAYKISPTLMGRTEKTPPNKLATMSIATEKFKPNPIGNINVVLHELADPTKVAKQIEEIGGTVVSIGKDRIRTSIDPGKISQIANIADIKWIEPYILPKLLNDVARQILGVQPTLDNHGLAGEGQIVAVADTGLDTGVNDATMHQDFQGRIVSIHSWPITSGLQQYCDNTSFDDGASDLDSGHGTHVAGSVLGNGARSGGIIKGSACDAQIVFQAVEQYVKWKQAVKNQYPDLTDGYYLVGIPDDLKDLFQQAYNDGARIHTNSWGSNQDDQGNEAYGHYLQNTRDIDEFIWKNKDMTILFAAGNDGKDLLPPNGIIDLNSLSIQPSAKNCISVGASENNRPHGSNPPPAYDFEYGHWADFPNPPISTDHISDNPEGMAAFSSRGPTYDGRIKPDIVAPGTNILSVRSSVCTNQTIWGLLPTSNPNRPYYMYMGGTSMATPLAAGTVALIREYVQNACLYKKPSSALLKALLIHGAKPMQGQYTAPYKDVGSPPENNEGWGRPDLTRTLFPVFPESFQFVDDPNETLATGNHKDKSVNVVDASVPLKATLTWTDAPSDVAAGGGLVNVLSLSIIDPHGAVTQGLFSNNNVQQIIIQNPTIGIYTVRVNGDNVATTIMTGEKQDYALVVSGGLEHVDLYIRDSSTDNGVAPLAERKNKSPDIKLKQVNKKVKITVTVHNRGTEKANKAKVSLYWASTSTWPLPATRQIWYINGVEVGNLTKNTQTVDIPPHAGTSDGSAKANFVLDIRDQKVQNALKKRKIIAIIATVDHPADPLKRRLVRWENNVAAKKLTIIP